MPIKQLIDLEKVRTDYLKFRTDLGDRIVDGWSVTQCLQRKIAKKIFKLKIEAHPVNAGHYMAFKHCISFAIYLAANFGHNQFRITPDFVFQAFARSHLK